MHFRVSIFGLFKYPIKSPFPASLAERIRRLQLPFITQRRRACLSRCPLLTCMHSLKLMLMHEQLPRPRAVHFGVCIVLIPLTTTCLFCCHLQSALLHPIYSVLSSSTYIRCMVAFSGGNTAHGNFRLDPGHCSCDHHQRLVQKLGLA